MGFGPGAFQGSSPYRSDMILRKASSNSLLIVLMKNSSLPESNVYGLLRHEPGSSRVGECNPVETCVKLQAPRLDKGAFVDCRDFNVSIHQLPRKKREVDTYDVGEGLATVGGAGLERSNLSNIGTGSSDLGENRSGLKNLHTSNAVNGLGRNRCSCESVRLSLDVTDRAQDF